MNIDHPKPMVGSPLEAWQQGRSLRLSGNPAEALKVLRQGLATESRDYRLHDELGMALIDLNRPEEAIGSFLAALELKPDFDEACNKIGSAYASRGLIEPAAVWFLRGRQLNPEATKYLYAYGCVLVQLDSRRQAAEVFEQWLQADPQNPIARHLSAAALGSQSISKASPGYVRALFDQYASHFDENLARLRYCGPELVLRALTHLGTVATGGWKVLDAGCGTGLVGAALRPLASELIGVDLSTVMLDVARRRMIYDDLVCSDIVDYFRERFQEFDVIAAADLLTYIGDLREFFEHAAHALRPGGFVVALAESLKTAEDYRLNPTGRFSHSREYLHQVMSSAGLTVPYFEEDAMRHESKKPISTWVAVGTLARV